MIYLYSGTPGSGKSCHQAEMIYSIMQRKNGCVLANYSINVERIKHARGLFVECSNDELNPVDLIRFSRWFFKKHPFREGAIKLFIDEAQLLFNSRDWDKKGRSDWLKFFSQHRKYGYDVFLVAQFDRMLDRQIRSLIEYEVIHRKISAGGVMGSLVNFFLGGHVYIAITVWYPMKQQLYSEYHHTYARYYSLYDSYSDFSGFNSDDYKGVSELGSGRSMLPGSETAPVGDINKAERSAAAFRPAE